MSEVSTVFCPTDSQSVSDGWMDAFQLHTVSQSVSQSVSAREPGDRGSEGPFVRAAASCRIYPLSTEVEEV